MTRLNAPINPSNRLCNHKPVILVVEDQDVIRSLAAEFLSDTGFEVIEVSNGTDALAVLSSTTVDLIFSDINLPGAVSGQAIATWLSNHKPEVPILLTSGASNALLHNDRQQFIRKPYMLITVEAQIRELLQ